MDLTDIYRTFYPDTKEHMFSAPLGIFSKTDHTLGDKANLNRYNSNTNCRKSTNFWNLNNA